MLNKYYTMCIETFRKKLDINFILKDINKLSKTVINGKRKGYEYLIICKNET